MANPANWISLVAQRPVLAVTLLGILLLVTVWQVDRYARSRRYKLPPRIPGVPFFGNTFQLPPLKQGVWAMQMAKQYGEMCGNNP
jgi:hypothetical protein